VHCPLALTHTPSERVQKRAEFKDMIKKIICWLFGCKREQRFYTVTGNPGEPNYNVQYDCSYYYSQCPRCEKELK